MLAENGRDLSLTAMTASSGTCISTGDAQVLLDVPPEPGKGRGLQGQARVNEPVPVLMGVART
jgi:hypothetical protein